MKNFSRHTIVIGMVLTLLMAFSAPHSADAIDAITRKNSGTTDLSTVATGSDLTIDFAVDDSAVSGFYANEAVSISVSGAGAMIYRIGPTRTITPTNSYTWKETGQPAGHPNLAVNGTATNSLRCSTSSYGVVTIEISDATTDRQSGDNPAATLIYTVYVTRSTSADRATDNIRFLNSTTTNGVGRGFVDSDVQIDGRDSGSYHVTYAVIPRASAQLLIKEGNRTREVSIPTDPRAALPVISSDAPVYLKRDTETLTVTAAVRGGRTSSAVYIYGTPTLEIASGTQTATNTAKGPGERINDIEVVIKDGAGNPVGVNGVPIQFDVRNKGISGGSLIPSDADNSAYKVITPNNVEVPNPQPGKTIYVRSAQAGKAKIHFQMGTAPENNVITVTAHTHGLRLTKTIEFQSNAPGGGRLRISANQARSGSPNIFDLVALVERNGRPDEGRSVRFTTTKGFLTNTPRNPSANHATDPDRKAALTSKDVTDVSDVQGKAQVIYNLGDTTGGADVVATVAWTSGTTVVDFQRITFRVRGGSGTTPGTTPGTAPTVTPTTPAAQPRLALSISPASGTATSRTLTLRALNAAGAAVPGVSVRLTGTGTGFTLNQTVTAGTTIPPITVPSAPGTYTITAAATGYQVARATATVTAPPTPGTLTLATVGTPTGRSFTIRVTARTSANVAPTTPVSVTLSGTGFTRAVSLTGGTATVTITLPATVPVGSYTLTGRATGYADRALTLTVSDQTVTPPPTVTPPVTPPTVTPPTVTPPVTPPEPDRITISGPGQRTGTINTALDTPLLTQVLDGEGDGVAAARVIYRVRTGQGRLSQRGNGRAVAVETDSDGYARAEFTPLSAGTITVEASVRGIDETVTFTITTSGATPPSTVTPPPRDINPVVHVGAANRPPMIWVDSGAIYTLVGANVQRFAASVDNALNLTVDAATRKVYWTERTGDSTGTINSANLDGSSVTELASILSVPMGIAVDTANRKLYWTNSRGRIQSANLNGSNIQNVLQNLPQPRDIALAGGNAYWTQANGSVRLVNLASTRNIRDIATGMDTPGSLVVGGGKVYWTERTGESGGTVHSANLNGIGATQIASILAAPMGIAVDTARSKLYWTNSRGRIQSANLDGSGIQNVVDGLGNPGDFALSSALTGQTATNTPPKTPTTPDTSKYDVNKDGKVDNRDASLVASAIGTNETKYDVNTDGKVDFLDLLLIFDNRDSTAAAAPTVVGLHLSPVQIDRLQEQIELLIATNDRSPAAMRTLIYLQQLLATARPEQTQLLANYPNPFNPETWIPYELARDTSVRITIYDARGDVVRTLALGQQSAGYYTDRDRAAYWDGRNAVGERVSSGVYFYQLETDTVSATRKMVILK